MRSNAIARPRLRISSGSCMLQRCWRHKVARRSETHLALAGLHHRLRRALGIIKGDKVDLAPIAAAIVSDAAEVIAHRLADGAVGRRWLRPRHDVADLKARHQMALAAELGVRSFVAAIVRAAVASALSDGTPSAPDRERCGSPLVCQSPPSAAGQLQQIWVSLSDLLRLIDRSEIDGLIVEALGPTRLARGAAEAIDVSSSASTKNVHELSSLDRSAPLAAPTDPQS